MCVCIYACINVLTKLMYFQQILQDTTTYIGSINIMVMHGYGYRATVMVWLASIVLILCEKKP